ncbi:MAG: hypothetical protein JO015_13210 [Verrucomicrobia bacterium]|nr:hypothetical protein [Verrucomicrobiota bacterium]
MPLTRVRNRSGRPLISPSDATTTPCQTNQKLEAAKRICFMGFDIRLPIGYLFTILGLLLTLYGLTTNGAAFYQRSLGLNINLSWGVALLIFGLIMAYFANRSRSRLRREVPETLPEGSAPTQRLH